MNNRTAGDEARGRLEESKTVEFVERLLDERTKAASLEDRGAASPTRVAALDHELLQWLADYFGIKKTAFANDLLALAMEDAVRCIALREGRGVSEKMGEVYPRGPRRTEPGWITEVGGETWTRARSK